MSGGKGGSTTSQVQIPEYIEAAAQRNLNKAERISQLGYVPYYGPDVAALTPMQQASMQNVAGAAGAFGLSAPTGQDIYGMPAPTTYAGGVQGYSSAPMFEQAQAELARRRPAQKSYIDSFFIDPFTGTYGSNVQAPIDYTSYATGAQRRPPLFDLAMSGNKAGSALSQAEFNKNVGVIGAVIGDPSYDGTRVLTPSERFLVSESPAAQMAQDTIYMNQFANQATGLRDLPATLMGKEPSFESPSSKGSYGGSLVTGGLSGSFTPIGGLTGKIIDKGVSAFAPDYARQKQGEAMAKAAGSTKKADGSYDISSWFKDTSATPTLKPTAKPVATPTVSSSTSTRGSSPRPVLRPSSSSSSSSSSTKSTTIKSGDTLSSIAKKNNTTVSAIMKANPSIKDANKIYAGAKISVPSKSKSSGGSSKSSSSKSSGSSGGGSSKSSSSKKILCCAYHNMGYLPREIWRLDQRYGVWLHRNDPEMMAGYHVWAAPLSLYIQKDTIPAKALRAVMWPIVKAWAEEMAHNMKPEEYKPNYFGKLIKFVGEPFSRMCGKLKPRKVEGVA